MPVSQYERDRIARVAARASNKGSKKKQVKKSLSQKERAQADINQYNAQFRAAPKRDTRPLDSLTRYGKSDSTATSGGSKAVRKIDPTFKGSTTPAKTGNNLVDRLRRKPFKYLK